MKPKSSSSRLFFRVLAVALFSLSCLVAAQTSATRRSKGPGKIVVRTKFGGQIFGFDIDQNGTEGVLADVQIGGNNVSAVETFDQKTGKILKVISKTESPNDDDIVIGIVGTSVAIVEHEHAGVNGFVTKRPYHLIDPLNSNKYTGLWKPPHFNKNDIVIGLSRNQGMPSAAFLVLDNVFPGFNNFVFGWDVATNTFGQEVKMTGDPNFEPYVVPAITLDTKSNTAVLAQDTGCPACNPDIGLVDLANGEFSHFSGLGVGRVNGLAVDSEDGIACTTTANDSNVQFYDLKTQTGFTEPLPGASGRLQSGTDVEFDPIHKLFLVGQPISSTGQGSSIQVYDPKGNLVESLNGFNSGFGYIALLPKHRSGFVNDPVGLRSFTY
jgi:WD40 repeat protein